jgi:hypothetical protein
VTCLVEDITIKITLCHCAADSTVLGGKADLRAMACNMLAQALPSFLAVRDFKAPYVFDTEGILIKMENTGLYEAPEVGGGDN